MKQGMDGLGELAPGWTEHLADNGAVYYYNAALGISSWERPIVQKADYSSLKRSLSSSSALESKRVQLEGTDDNEAVGANDESVSPERRRAALDERKARLSELLESRDEIFDPNVVQIINDWVTTIDSLADLNRVSKSDLLATCAQQAAKKLSDGYDGCGDHATILGEMLDLATHSGRALELGNKRIIDLVSTSDAISRFNELLVSHENPPAWLLELLSLKEWRVYFMDLATKNPSAPFSTFCVRYIAESGHYHEIAQSVTSSAYFSVFERAFGDAVEQLVKACEGDKIMREAVGSLISRLVQLSDSCLHTSFYCGQLLFDLERNSELKMSTRYAMAHIRQRVQHFRMKLLHRGGLRNDCPPLAVVLAKVMSGDKDACEACPDIAECYKSEISPPRWPLCERDFLDRVVGGLFRPGRRLESDVRTSACTVIALAACTTQYGGNEGIDITELKQALEACSIICNDPATSSALESKWPQLLPFCEKHPTCSIGVLFWARALLLQHDFLISHAFATSFTVICKIAQFASAKYALQRSHAFAVLKKALETKIPTDEDSMAVGSYLSDARLAELSEHVIDAMVDLMARGFVMPVLDHFIQQASALDLSLLRKFLVGVLEVAEAPFSKTFKDKLTSLLQSSEGLKAGLGGGAEFEQLKVRFLAGAVLI